MKPIFYCFGCLLEAMEKVLAAVGDLIDCFIDGCLDSLDSGLEWVEEHLNEDI